MAEDIKLIIGLTGSLGSGCTTAARKLGENGYNYISISSDILEPLSKKYSLPFNKPHEKQDFGNYVRKHLRNEYKEQLLQQVKEKGNNVVIECFRNPIEIDFLRDVFPHFYLIALFAPKEERKKRSSIKEFDSVDKRDEEEKDKYGQHVKKCVNNADIVIDNSTHWLTVTDADNFFKNLFNYIRLLKEPWRKPTEEEMLMHLAYSVSLHSDCIQRQVGAVIADENYRPLSTGYNDVPQDSESCFDLYSRCYREMKKEARLSEHDEIKHCIFCGEALNPQGELLDPELRFKCSKCAKALLDIISPGKELDFCRSLHAEENAILSNPHLDGNIYSREKN